MQSLRQRLSSYIYSQRSSVHGMVLIVAGTSLNTWASAHDTNFWMHGLCFGVNLIGLGLMSAGRAVFDRKD